MSLSILNNISALRAQTQLAATQINLKKSLNQLSTGSRINSGADDAAGLSIADGMDANILALTQSSRNAADGTGLLQTADGALSQVSVMLNRAITLATQAATGSVTDGQRSAIDAEFQKILAEINAVGSGTTFNGMQVFTDLDITPFLSDGTNGNSISGMSIGTLSADDLGLAEASTNATNTLTLTSNVAAGGTVTIGSTTYTFQSGAPASAGQVQIGGNIAATLQNLARAVNGTDGVNSANASATASATASAITFTATAAGTAGNGVTASGSLTEQSAGSPGQFWNWGQLVGGTDLNTASYMLTTWFAPLPGSTVTVGGTKYTFVTSLSDNGGAANQILTGATGFTALTNFGKAINGTGIAGVDYTVGTQAKPNLFAHEATFDGSPTNGYLVIDSRNPGAIGEADFGSPERDGSGFMDWWHEVRGTDVTAPIEHMNLTSNVSAGDTITIASTTYTFQAGAPSSAGQVQIGADPAATLQNLAAAINGADGVNSADPIVSATVTGTTINFTGRVAGTLLNGTSMSLDAGGGSAGTWSNGSTLGGGADAANQSDLLTAPNAKTALLAVSDAISKVAQMRGRLGAYLNQLHAASNVMQTQVQKLSSAASNIRDADIGKAVADVTRDNILQQTGMTAMQQANQAQQSVLKLLQ